MVKCPRCGRNVEELQSVTPDVISKELIDSIDHAEEDVVGKDGMKVCAGCMNELKAD